MYMHIDSYMESLGKSKYHLINALICEIIGIHSQHRIYIVLRDLT